MISINGRGIKPMMFPDKTSQVWKLPKDLLDDIYKEGICDVRWEFESESELIHLAQLKTLLDTYIPYVNLDVPYLPYARQDKRIENESTFALYAFARLINALNFNRIWVIDAHNNQRAHMIDRLEDLSPRKFIQDALDETGANRLLFPDAGARQRYGAHNIAPAVFADKVRDPSTGIIKSIAIEGNVSGKSLLIVDDLCDGGMTFKMVAEEVLLQDAKEVHLYVTHGLFSKGLETLRASGIKRIFTHKGEVK